MNQLPIAHFMIVNICLLFLQPLFNLFLDLYSDEHSRIYLCRLITLYRISKEYHFTDN